MNPKKREKGAVIIFALIFIFVCMVAGGSYLAVVTNECRQAKKEIESIKAFYLAEVGIEYGIWKVKQGNP